MRSALAVMAMMASAALASPQTHPTQPPPIKVSCIARNVGSVTYHHDSKELTEEDDWYVDCEVKSNEKLLWHGPLTLAHPAPFREAMEAIEEFRTKKAAQLAKDAHK